MKYYINKNKETFGFELDGSQDHLIIDDMTSISLEEIQAINKAKEDEYKLSPEYRLQEAKTYLASTDFYMTVDKYETLTPERQLELKTKRTEARELMNTPESEFTEEELLTKKQNEFRRDRNILLDKVDKAINIAEDLGQDSTILRTYRQALRDATMTWAMPESVL